VFHLVYILSEPEGEPPLGAILLKAHAMWLTAHNARDLKLDNPEQSKANAIATRIRTTNNHMTASKGKKKTGTTEETTSGLNNTEETTSDLEEEDVERVLREDPAMASLQELAEIANLTLGTGPVTEDMYRRCIEALMEKQTDAYNNVQFCLVCDLFKKKDRFKRKFDANAVDIGDRKLLHAMQARLKHDDILGGPLPSSIETPFVPTSLSAEPPLRSASVMDQDRLQDGCREQALQVGETRGIQNNGTLKIFQGLILSTAGFVKKAVPPSTGPDYFNLCVTCYNSLTSDSKKLLPPAESLANNTFIGTCWLPELSSVQYKMLSLIYTKTEVVIYKLYKGAHTYLTGHVLSYANKTPVDPEMFPILAQLPRKLTKGNFTAVFSGTFDAWAKIAAR